MAEIHPKRLRDETATKATSDDSSRSPKRQKPYECSILELLDDDEDDGMLTQELSAMLTSFQRELESPEATEREEMPETGDSVTQVEDAVVRHLLEASDEELGIPNGTEDVSKSNVDGGENIPFGLDGNEFWELNDEVAAELYGVLKQSE